MLLSSLQRLAAACGPSGLGRGGIAVAASCGSSSSSSSLWQQLRAFSDEAGSGDKPGEEPAAAAASAAADDVAGGSEGGDDALVAAEAAEGDEEVEEVDEDVPFGLIDFDSAAGTGGGVVPPELFSKRQRAWLGVGDPDKYQHFLPALSRKEKGSFADEYVEEEFDVEQELYPTVPEDKPLYDLRESVPEIYQPRSELFERLQRLKAEHPDMPIQQFVSEVVGIGSAPEQPPRPGARPIIRWQICHVLSVGVSESHPANKRVKAWVHLRDLQRDQGLTDAALRHIAAICGPRYDPNRGELKLTSDRYPHREANRAHILRIIKELVKEGHRKHPKQQQQQQQQQQADATS
ncbi:expressed protein [Chlorella variabilis]|uniref:Expressed protein n=1 Tax=Chlorella variabilis TaxID=554065 RepID=E1Z533_CHLVA|nr:expressed protein [Chlorella variabilis]EFN59453.1 expressed protein [Chlorella variabilis]|eukprot:XP_005851555.1 expressed protein [Chlorella variabilis]